jgi:hypothetical protein
MNRNDGSGKKLDDEMYQKRHEERQAKEQAEAEAEAMKNPIQKKVDDYNNKAEKTEFTSRPKFKNSDEFRIGSREDPWKKYVAIGLVSIKGYLCLGIIRSEGDNIDAVIKSYSDTEDIESTRSYSSSIGLSMVGNTRKGRIDILASENAYDELMKSDTKITRDQVENNEKLPDIINWNNITDLKTYSLSISDNNDYKKVKKILEEKVPKTITKGGKKKKTRRRSLKKRKSKRKNKKGNKQTLRKKSKKRKISK